MPSRRYETLASHIRFGSKADIGARLDHVRFVPTDIRPETHTLPTDFSFNG